MCRTRAGRPTYCIVHRQHCCSARELWLIRFSCRTSIQSAQAFLCNSLLLAPIGSQRTDKLSLQTGSYSSGLVGFSGAKRFGVSQVRVVESWSGWSRGFPNGVGQVVHVLFLVSG